MKTNKYIYSIIFVLLLVFIGNISTAKARTISEVAAEEVALKHANVIKNIIHSYKINMNNESCIDEKNLKLKMNEGFVEDIRFDGEECAICNSYT